MPVRMMPCDPKVDHPAEHRAEQRDLHRFERGCARKRRLGPPTLLDEDCKVDTESLVQQQALQKLQGAAGKHDAPAVENLHGMPGRITYDSPSPMAHSIKWSPGLMPGCRLIRRARISKKPL